MTPEELLSRIDTGPLPEIYNATYFSIYQSASTNQYGSATTSHIEATKICSLAGDWERLITKQHTPKQMLKYRAMPNFTNGGIKQCSTGKVSLNFIHSLYLGKIWKFNKGVLSFCVSN